MHRVTPDNSMLLQHSLSKKILKMVRNGIAVQAQRELKQKSARKRDPALPYFDFERGHTPIEGRTIEPSWLNLESIEKEII